MTPMREIHLQIVLISIALRKSPDELTYQKCLAAMYVYARVSVVKTFMVTSPTRTQESVILSSIS